MLRMMRALFALVALTAFAPAPFPRKTREDAGTSIDLDRLQGKWRVVSIFAFTKGKKKAEKYFHEDLVILGDKWTHLDGDGEQSTRYAFTIDSTTTPATIDFDVTSREGRRIELSVIGIIRRRGKRIEILQYGPAKVPRVNRFDNPPDNWFLMTLERAE